MVRLATNVAIADLLRTPRRFLRSTQLDRDYNDPQALEDYCLTGFGLQCLVSIAEGFDTRSSRRAWRFTGDYGTGKSSFALLLARCAQSANGGLPKTLQATILKRAPRLKERNFIPLLIVGAREPMNRAILRRLSQLVTERFMRVVSAVVRKRLHSVVKDDSAPSDVDVIELLETVNAELIAARQAEGILLILDEAGKFLEHSALQPEANDVMLLQKLAETASRSGTKPLVVVCLFHIAFSSYAAQLSPSSQREWDKVAGRFEEITFKQPLDQIASLVAAALRVNTARVPESLLSEGRAVMDQARKWMWFGAGSASDAWNTLTPEIFPLDPLLLPVATRIFQRFSQNERSLFSFLFSHEAFGLRAFAARPLVQADWLKLPQFFDYVRANLGQRLSQASYRSRWPVIEAVFEASTELEEQERDILKTIGLFNLINADDLRPTEEAIVWAVAGAEQSRQKSVKRSLATLAKSHRVFFRGASRGYCLWPYSSVDLDKAFDDARRELPEVSSMADALHKSLIRRPLVARRHYIETGNLRYFEVEYAPVTQLGVRLQSAENSRNGDGSIIIALCEDEAERRAALDVATTPGVADRLTLLGVTRPLRQLNGFVLEVQRWEWVASNTPELNSDRYAREEVSKQIAHARDLLSRQLEDFIGLDRASGTNTLEWFLQGQRIFHLRCGSDLLRELSEMCERIYGEHGLRLHNELLNREVISSAAAGARIRLIERLLLHADLPQLGIPVGKHPPELSMYLSVMRNACLHKEIDGVWGVHLPASADDDPCNLRHVFDYIRRTLEEKPDARIALSLLYHGLAAFPYGVRQGIMPLLMAVFYVFHSHEIAFYERGNFVADVIGDVFLRLSKVPEIFEMQWCRIEGLRAEVLDDLRQTLALPLPTARRTRLLEIVRALCNFAVKLPEFSRKTRRLTPASLSVREALLSAREPVKLLLYRLPEACGLPSFPPGEQSSLSTAQNFVRRLHESLRELQGAYAALLQRLEYRLHLHFRLDPSTPEAARLQIIARANRLRTHLREPRLIAFSNYLSDTALTGAAWTEALASFLAQKPPSYWLDADEAKFDTELADLCGIFSRVESLHFNGLANTDAGRSFRVAVTQADGEEVAEVIHLAVADEDQLATVQQRFATIFQHEGTIAIAAAAQELGRLLRRPYLP